ncbi:dihydroorotate dehydrogenase-like protein [Marinilabiliaceae bacterium JC017]|nr:dihydroorotate dehydrogenase-like protein [Marinilabiliaceae bacterium JC017]
MVVELQLQCMSISVIKQKTKKLITMKDLSTTFFGLPVKNPIIVGSSGLASTIGGIKKLADNGAGAIVLKSVFEEEILSEADNTVNQQLGADENNMEFFDYYDYQVKRDVLDNYVSLIHEAKSKVDVPIIGSINCSSSSEWISYAKRIEKAGADALELNIFKLPSDVHANSEKIEKIYFDIAKRIKDHISIPVGLKVAPYFTNMANVISRLSYSGVEGIVLFNRFTSVDFDIETDQFTTRNVYSSNDEYGMSLRWISIMADKVGCDLIASTGVHDATTLIKMVMVGAASVEVVSAIYKNGPEIIGSIIKEMEAWMERRGFNSLNDFKGQMSQKESDCPEVFERVQFMKYFSDHAVKL